jgi:hypothetical protein
MKDFWRESLTKADEAVVSDSETYSPLFNRERRENTRKLAMGPLCGQLALALAVGNVPALRVHFSLLIANWQRYALTPLLIAHC